MESRSIRPLFMTALFVAFAFAPLAAFPQAATQESPGARLATAIDASGQKWQKSQNNVWVQVRDGRNIPRIGVFATSAEDVVVVGATVADAKSLRLDAAKARRLLTMAGNYYKVKATLIENGNLVIRIDTAARLIDGAELAAQADLIVRAADEISGTLKTASPSGK